MASTGGMRSLLSGHQAQPGARELPALLSEKDLARLTGLSLSTIRRRRAAGQAPLPCRLGKAIRYRATTVESWLRDAEGGGGSRA
jgi:predicted DNA-binding transcriptional regulator AlpA